MQNKAQALTLAQKYLISCAKMVLVRYQHVHASILKWNSVSANTLKCVRMILLVSAHFFHCVNE